MRGIFVNEDEYPYADLIVRGQKIYETRNKDMLKDLLGERVAIISTKRDRKPCIVGYATIQSKTILNKSDSAHDFWDYWYRDMAMIPKGSKYDDVSNGKVLYKMHNVQKCEPYTLPSDAVRHGRSWCEWKERK